MILFQLKRELLRNSAFQEKLLEIGGMLAERDAVTVLYVVGTEKPRNPPGDSLVSWKLPAF